MADFESAIQQVESGIDLSTEDMQSLVESMLVGEVDVESSRADQVRRLLLGLRNKGETVDELVGAAKAMRRNMTPIQHYVQPEKLTMAPEASVYASVLLDTCGTGGSGSGTFNISTAAAIVISAAGVPVAKHGNRKATSRSGSADVLAELGVRIESDRETVQRSLRELNLCFCFAPVLHPAMKHVAAIRRSLSVPTMFNLLGPLCNPAGATHQLLGTGKAEVQAKLAESLLRLGTRRSIVVRGEDGQDEVTLDGVTTVIEVGSGVETKTHRWTASMFGLLPAGADAMQADDPQHSAQIIRAIFAGTPGPCRDIVIANAAAGFWLVERAATLYDAAKLAAEIIDSGQAAIQLDKFASITGQPSQHDSTKSQQSLTQSEPSFPVSSTRSAPRFSQQAIELAHQLKTHGLDWQPQPGHYVFDPQRILPHTSPFQDRVFFILDLKHFLRYAGSMEKLVADMIWLPDWWDARGILRDLGVADLDIAQMLDRRNAIATGEELVVLYEMILKRLGVNAA